MVLATALIQNPFLSQRPHHIPCNYNFVPGIMGKKDSDCEVLHQHINFSKFCPHHFSLKIDKISVKHFKLLKSLGIG